MNELLKQAAARFTGKVNLLLVDDDRHILKSLESIFSSPIFSIHAIDSFQSARSVAATGNPTWHCWVLDIDLGEGNTGIQIMEKNPMFPFVVVLSGLQSMSVAAEAVRKGALAVFDKSPDTFDTLYEEVCKTAALGYLLGGRQTQYLETYRLLCREVIATPEEWAEKACVSVRQLHRICDVHPVTSPKFSLALFYTLFLLLWKGKRADGIALPGMITGMNRPLVEEAIANFLKKG